MSAATLNSEDRAFFYSLTDTIFSNPFDERAGRRAARFSPQIEAGSSFHTHYLNTVVPAMNARMQRLEREGSSRLQDFHSEDRQLLEYVFLFQVYHRYLDELDTLIEIQFGHDEPVEVPFAEQVLAQLKTRGFSDSESVRYLGLFYQLRRAYYFIVRSLVGESPCMRQLQRALWNNVFTYDVRLYDRHLWNRMEDFSTLLLGETGSGKGAAAAAIGRSAFIPFDRKSGCFADSFTRAFVAINLSQFPESLIESELFGHRKGAFTGAVEHHQGVFERCSSHGALFLDEIGDVSVPIQIKLLKVLQERRFSPVGSHSQKRFSGRVIAATNHTLEQKRRDGEFRDDFFYRLCSDTIEVPPLRQRIAESPGELERMVMLLVARLAGRENGEMSAMVMERLTTTLPANYSWPGNVRELEQAVRRILLSRRYAGDTAITDTHLADTLLRQIDAGALTARELLGAYCQRLYARHGSYEDVARTTRLDRRTVKKYIQRNKSAV